MTVDIYERLRSEASDRKLSALERFKAWAALAKEEGGIKNTDRQRLDRYAKRALKAMGVDGSEREHWVNAALFLAGAVYRQPKIGRKRYWTKKRRKRLKKRIATLGKQHQNYSMLQLCELLRKEKNYRFSAETLRRRLYRGSPKTRKKSPTENWD